MLIVRMYTKPVTPRLTVCGNCRHELEPETPIWRLWGDAFGTTKLFPRCNYCVGDTAKLLRYRDWLPATPCCMCGRPVIREKLGKLPQRLVCGMRCRKAMKAWLVRQQRDISHWNQRCAAAGCGKWFTPSRRDAAYCSPACKQRAYRLAHRTP